MLDVVQSSVRLISSRQVNVCVCDKVCVCVGVGVGVGVCVCVCVTNVATPKMHSAARAHPPLNTKHLQPLSSSQLTP